jgi:hypothetical protein
MEVPLTSREIEYVLRWKEKIFWPDEDRIVRKLRTALEVQQGLNLSFIQIQIIHGWAEERVGGHFGSKVVNSEENSIMRKLEDVLEANAG